MIKSPDSNTFAVVRATLLTVALAMLVTSVCGAWGQTTRYDALVSQAKADLTAGKLDAALNNAKQAVALDGSRWEAYTVAGGALVKLNRCVEATEYLKNAVQRAPETKRDGISKLSNLCSPASKQGQQSVRLKVGDFAPDFTLQGFDGSDLRQFSLHDLKGQPVLVAFCGISFTAESQQALLSLEDRSKHEGIRVIALTFDSPFVNYAYQQQLGIQRVTILSDGDGGISALYGVPFPRDLRSIRQLIYLINADGKVARVSD
jgi:peroxiredoxin